MVIERRIRTIRVLNHISRNLTIAAEIGVWDVSYVRSNAADPDKRRYAEIVNHTISKKEISILPDCFNNAVGKNSPTSIGGEMNFRPNSGI